MQLKLINLSICTPTSTNTINTQQQNRGRNTFIKIIYGTFKRHYIIVKFPVIIIYIYIYIYIYSSQHSPLQNIIIHNTHHFQTSTLYAKMHFIPKTYMHVVPILLINFVCQSYVTEHTLTNLTNFSDNDMMYEERLTNTLYKIRSSSLVHSSNICLSHHYSTTLHNMYITNIHNHYTIYISQISARNMYIYIYISKYQHHRQYLTHR